MLLLVVQTLGYWLPAGILVFSLVLKIKLIHKCQLLRSKVQKMSFVLFLIMC